MDGTRHRLTGFVVGGTYGALSPWPLLMVVPCAVVGATAALMPDLDTPKSIATTFVNKTIILRPARWFAALISGGPNNHRTTTHWLPLWGFVAYLSYVADVPLWAHILLTAFWIGYFLHIAEDAMTTDGVPLMVLRRVPLLGLPIVWPGGHWHILPWGLRFKSGSPVRERIAVGLIVAACVVALTDHYIPQAHASYTLALLHVAYGIHAAVMAL